MTIKDTDPKEGFFTFVHHDVPIEYSDDIEKRITYIYLFKPPHEWDERIRCIVYVPKDRVPVEYVETMEALKKANHDTHGPGTPSWQPFMAAYVHFESVKIASHDTLLALALELVPDAPWDASERCLVFPKVDNAPVSA